MRPKRLAIGARQGASRVAADPGLVARADRVDRDVVVQAGARHLRGAAAARVRADAGSTTSISGRSWGGFFTGLLNSLIVTAGATLLAVAASALAGYRLFALSQPRPWPAARFFLICVRLIPPIVITLPLFPIVNWLRLNDTHLVLILLYATFFVSLGTLVMRTFIDQIPRELDEAAHGRRRQRSSRSCGA